METDLVPADIIQLFKNEENHSQIVCLFNKPQLAEVLSAFKVLKTKKVLSYNLILNKDLINDKELLWSMLWQGYEFDYKSYEKLTSVRGNKLKMFLEVLKGYRLIYPTGQTNDFAEIFLKDYVGKRLSLNKKK